jgi:colanic acid/amylovoran biosynthesis glycosyltransferase
VRRNVLIYRDLLLPPSETFVRGQGEMLEGFTAYYAGSRRVSGLELPEDRVLTVNRGDVLGWAAEAYARYVRFPRDFVRRARGLEPALIHAHFGLDGAQALPLARELGVPLVVTFHGFDATMTDEFAGRSFHKHRLYLRRRKELQRAGALFLAVSEFVRGRLLDQGYPEERLVVHYTGVDVEEFEPAREEAREPVVLFVGRLVEKKGCEYLIRAMERVQRERPEVSLWVIGDGPLRGPLERLAQERLRAARFLGGQPPEEVRRRIGRAKVFCVPSVVAESGDAEGFGMVFAEAQAMGTPVASFASGGIPEAVSDGETGLLAPERDAAGLAESILALLEDEELWSRMSAAGIEYVRRRFDLRRQTARLEELYERAIRG